MTHLSAASRIAAGWGVRLRQLRLSLRDKPDHWQAWRWQIQAKVLTYLILRYGDDPRLNMPEHPIAAAGFEAVFSVPHRLGSTIRSQSDLKLILERIAEINRFRV